ncbi:hypothetical protein GPECTOR_8g272 [Gonium pectorale]|uniref:Uncharacterized protein n=1 Tax=Gonium pectorale TaxID=33097 RepID=A0A150GT43_GONPE|nr:hypothetical protein GPECTOR_8g272 [Gonium pectorale]|eukprot:KXZ52892.1 hypothetical protein GPECTOR_8g272 [Gonium pectorale]
MDALLAVAVEEVALEGREGCQVPALWGLLNSKLPVGPITCMPAPLRKLVWELLVARTEDIHLVIPAPATAAVDAAPKQGKAKKKVAGPLDGATKASDAVRMSVLGVYDIQDSRFPLSDVQLAALEAVGRTRWRGTINADLANRLGVAYRNFYYIVKNLETRKLVVKNPVVFAPPGATVTVSSVLHLPRYQPAVKLGPGQMFKTVDAVRGMEVATYVLQDDNLYMRLVCETIAETPERLVVEGDLKLVCGFRGTKGHRVWRRLRKKLEDQGFLAFESCKVRDRLVPCVKLLKEWRPPADADEQEPGGEDGEEAEGDGDAPGPSSGNTIHVAERSLDRQLLDGILSGGPEGVFNQELFAKLGVSSKIFGSKLVEVIKRYNIQVTVVNKGRVVLNRMVAPPELLAAAGHNRLQATTLTLGQLVRKAAAEAAAADEAAGLKALPPPTDGALLALPAPPGAEPLAAATAAGTASARMSAAATASGAGPSDPRPRRAAAARARTSAAAALKALGGDGGAGGGDGSEDDYTAADAAEAEGLEGDDSDESIGEAIADTDEDEDMDAEDREADAPGRAAKRPRLSAVPATAGAGTPRWTDATARGAAAAGDATAAGDSADAAAAGSKQGKERRPHWTKVITLKSEDRLRLLVEHLQTARFISRVQVRRLVMEWESAASGRPIPTSGGGPDVKTIRRLMDRIAESGKAKLIRVETQGFLGDNRPIDTLLRPDLEPTPELLEEIRANMVEFERKLRSDCCRRAIAARKSVTQQDQQIGSLMQPQAGRALEAGPAATVGAAMAAAASAGTGGAYGTDAGDGPAAAAVEGGAARAAPASLTPAGLQPGARGRLASLRLSTAGISPGASGANGDSPVPMKNVFRAEANEATARSVENGLVAAKMVRVRLLHFFIAKLAGLGGFTPDPLAAVEPAPGTVPNLPRGIDEAVVTVGPGLDISRVAFAFGAMPAQDAGQAAGQQQGQPPRTAAQAVEGQQTGAGAAQQRLVSVRRLWSAMPLDLALQARDIMDASSMHRLEYLISVLRRLRLLEWAVQDAGHRPAWASVRQPGTQGSARRPNQGGNASLLVHAQGFLEVPPGKEAAIPVPAPAAAARPPRRAATASAASAASPSGSAAAAGAAPSPPVKYFTAPLTLVTGSAAAGTGATAAAAAKASSSGVGKGFLEVGLESEEGLDEYWKRFEMMYRQEWTQGTKEIPLMKKCFPATAVPEVLSRTSWHGQRLMSAVQWLKLQAALGDIDIQSSVEAS